MEVRAEVRENRLRDNSRVTVDDVCWYVDNPGVFVWEEDSKIVGFSARRSAHRQYLCAIVEEAYEGRGIGLALLERATEVLIEAGCPRMWLTTAPGDTDAAVLPQGRMACHRYRK
jgi:GNAT superfamily N-acetyltransferase